MLDSSLFKTVFLTLSLYLLQTTVTNAAECEFGIWRQDFSRLRWEPVSISNTITFKTNFTSIPNISVALLTSDMSYYKSGVNISVTSVSLTSFSFKLTTQYGIVYKTDFSWLAVNHPLIQSYSILLGIFDSTSSTFYSRIKSDDGIYEDLLPVSGFSSPNASAFISGYGFSTTKHSNDYGLQVNVVPFNSTHIKYKVRSFNKNTLVAVKIDFVVFENNENITSQQLAAPANSLSSSNAKTSYAKLTQNGNSSTVPIVFFGVNSFKIDGDREDTKFMTTENKIFNIENDTWQLEVNVMKWNYAKVEYFSYSVIWILNTDSFYTDCNETAYNESRRFYKNCKKKL